MTPEQLLTLVEHGGLAIVLFVLLQRVMQRLDTVTDKLIEILQHQSVIVAQLEDQRIENQRKQ